MANRPTFDQANDFLAHRPVPGVAFEHNDFVEITGGEHAGLMGSLVSVAQLGDDPVYLVEVDSGFDVHVPQAMLRLADD